MKQELELAERFSLHIQNELSAVRRRILTRNLGRRRALYNLLDVVFLPFDEEEQTRLIHRLRLVCEEVGHLDECQVKTFNWIKRHYLDCCDFSVSLGFDADLAAHFKRRFPRRLYRTE